jgi:heptosyltransferase-2
MKHLVILAPNWLGDAVMALPAIADVRRAAPDATITVAARPPVAPLFALVPDVTGTIVLERRASIGDVVGSWRAIGAELANRDFDTALLLPNSIHSALVASRAGILERWGYRSPFRSRLLTRAVTRGSRMHQVEHYQQLVRGLGFDNGSAEPRIHVPDDARAAGDRLLADAGWDGKTPLVALAPGAAYGGAKRWAPEAFGELAAALAADGVACVMIGSAADASTAADVERAFQARHATDGARACTTDGARAFTTDGAQAFTTGGARAFTTDGARAFTTGGARAFTTGGARAFQASDDTRLLDLVGRTTLPALAGVLKRCRTLVTNDSGAMHLAAAAGVAVTAVFGPTNERATRPAGDAHIVITHPVWCRPCMLRECPIDHRCMRGVRVATVLDAARRTL